MRTDLGRINGSRFKGLTSITMGRIEGMSWIMAICCFEVRIHRKRENVFHRMGFCLININSSNLIPNLILAKWFLQFHRILYADIHAMIRTRFYSKIPSMCMIFLFEKYEYKQIIHHSIQWLYYKFDTWKVLIKGELHVMNTNQKQKEINFKGKKLFLKQPSSET